MESVALMLPFVTSGQWLGVSLGFDAESAGVPQSEAPFVAAAAALAAGEPKRALSILDDIAAAGYDDGDRAAVERTLRRLALTLEHNWFPGGAAAVLDPGETAQFALSPLQASSSSVAIFVDIVDFFSSLSTLRTVAAGTRRGFAVPAEQDPVVIAESLVGRLREMQPSVALGAVALATADLYVRSGRIFQAGMPLGLALESAGALQDVAGVASCALVQGDFSAQPLSTPELLGEDLEGSAPGPPMAEPDVGFAAQRYQEARVRFSAAGSARGLAALELRTAGLAAASGDFTAAQEMLRRCGDLAADAGDGALTQLALVHDALIRIEAGASANLGVVAGRIVEWGTTVGSRSYVRGLARLCHARAQRLRNDALRARRALLLAEALNDGIGAITEPALVRRELAEQYASANYRRAAFVLGALDLREAESASAPTGMEWMRLADLALRLYSDANALKDSDAIERTLQHMKRVLELEPAEDPATAMFRLMLQRSTEESAVLAELYRGVEARAAGDDEAAETHFEEALTRSGALGADGALVRAVVLGTARRTSAARDLVEDLVAAGRLSPDLAANFFSRLGAYHLAEQQLDQFEAIALEPPSNERPWERPALRAEILAGSGRAREAVGVAETALASFEEHLANLSRDVLRTMASDSPVAAGLYTTAVRAHSDLAQEANAVAHVGASFVLSDRSRGVALTDLIDLDRAAGDDRTTVRAVRAWLKAGASLAQTIEVVGRDDSSSGDTDVRARIRAAEWELDNSEAALAATAPALLAGRRRLPASRSMAETREQLDPDTVLIQYHAYDDRLVLWAITADSARVFSRESITPVLGSQVRRYHRGISDPGSPESVRSELADPLAALLLAPVADELSAHRRVVFVPHGPLAVLPFHVLPFAGSDLAATHEVSYLPAVSAARPTAPRRIGHDARTLIVGDPDYGPASPFRPLPGARIEAMAVGGLRKTAPLIGAAANHADVLRELEEADVVHFATHGVLVEGSPFSAELALAQGVGLTVPDLMGLDTSISLAVLSACDSGRGRSTAAGDVIGLTRSLIAAGAAEMVVSLWPVDDMAACLTMVRFHAALLADESPARALRTATGATRTLSKSAAVEAYQDLTAGGAAVDTIRTARNVTLSHASAPNTDLSHPFYWAPFVHVGL
ncbi:CHAT domain-containing protein [Ornithinimicrobium pekingense]|uniref:CHAT domain-containing protein n=1 Tax=Ornithinimicrobium pekingense TaxID=384677 RepID=A0ABQ2F5K6_9MICO|nr:CHAT domain-containing protein [Ornithinimicrobium pekingense]GGK63310.1 hypothetical protein GCM10011509_09640 [Ornithinimicrobium pekingense]